MLTFIKFITIFLIAFTSVFTELQALDVFRTRVFSDDIKSLEVKVEGETISLPYIELNGEKKIEISFDALHHSTGRFAYSVIHCDANWKKSELLPLEYMKGFQSEAIEDFANAIGTTVHYTNYKLFLPNEDTQLLVSGNYAIQIYNEATPRQIVLTACFSIVEHLVEIKADILGNTDIDFNKEHQQVEFTINPKNLNITYPQTDLKVSVYQNNNLNDVRIDLQPVMITAKQLQYKYNRDLIFESGNEYRRIEFLSHRYYGKGIEDINFYNPYYHITLYEERKRDKTHYLYDQDQNGRFFIRCSGCEDPDTEGDYYVVHFSLVTDQIPHGKMFLYGDFFNNIYEDKSLMEYNTDKGAYEKAVLLKTGLYNYLYVFMEEGETNFSVKHTEGNFFETENEYTITVFYRPMGARYDRLIGNKTISNKKEGIH